MIGDRRAQLAAAARIAIVQMLRSERAHAPPDEGTEALQRALVDMGAAERERALPRCFDHGLRLLRFGRRRRNPRGDEGAGANGRVGKAVGDQPFIGSDDGVAAEAGLLGQCPRRRQRLTGFDQARDDHVAQRLV